MDCLREPGCHFEVVEDPKSLEVESEIVFKPDRDPGVADVTWRDILLPEDEGEKGGSCLDMVERKPQPS